MLKPKVPKKQYVNETWGSSSAVTFSRIPKPVAAPKYNSAEAKAKLNERASKRPLEDVEENQIEETRAPPKRAKKTTDGEQIERETTTKPKSKKAVEQLPKKDDKKPISAAKKTIEPATKKNEDKVAVNTSKNTSATVTKNAATKEASAPKKPEPKYPNLSTFKIPKKQTAVPVSSQPSKAPAKDDTRSRGRGQSPSPLAAGRTDHCSPPPLARKRLAHFDDGELHESKRVKEFGMRYDGQRRGKSPSGDNVRPALSRKLKAYDDIDTEMGEALPVAQDAEAKSEKKKNTLIAEPAKLKKKGMFDDSDSDSEDEGVELFDLNTTSSRASGLSQENRVGCFSSYKILILT